MGTATTKVTQQLPAQEITPESFQPYGQVIYASQDDKPYNSEDAQLMLENGIPRFYIIRLTENGSKFHKITRHVKCTQCLGSLEGKEWFMGVAPPGNRDRPLLEEIVAFRIPGNCFIKLEAGTWHAGPYISHEFVDFYNLELSDTNINDRETCNLLKTYNVEFEFVQ